MATLVLTAVLSPNPFWGGVLAGIGGMIDSQLFGSNTSFTQEGSKLSDLRLTTSTNGAAIPVVYGKVRLAGNVIWGTNYVEHRHEDTQTSGGGKGGGGGGGTTVTTITYTYTVSFAIALCEGVITSVNKCWADGKLIDLSNIQHTVYIGTEGQQPDAWIEAIDGVGNVPAYRGLAYIVFKDFDVTDYGNRIPALSFEIYRNMVNLKDVVTEISTQAGLEPAEIDATDLDGLAVGGYWISGDKSFRNRIEQLQAINTFDAVEWEGKVVFSQRNTMNSLQIPEEDLGAYETSKPTEIFKRTRKQETELPRLVTVTYISSDKDYQTGTMPAKRQITKSVNEVTINLDMVLTDAWAKAVAEQRLYDNWIGRTSYELSVPARYASIGPGRILEIPNGDRSDLMLVTKSTFGQPGINKINAVNIGKTAYLPRTRTADGEVTAELPSGTVEADVDILDIPKLPWDTDTTDHVYLASTGTPFYGANIFRSDDGGVSFRLITQDTMKSSKGFAATVLAAGTTFFFDWANTVDVVMSTGTLSSRPSEDVLNGYNAGLLGREIIQWTTATLIAEKTYRLSGLLRGRMGTEYEVANHVVGDKFVLLNQNMSKLSLPTADWYRDVLFRVGSSVMAVTDATYKDAHFTGQGVAARPFSVCHIKASRNASGDITLSWIRRTRGDGSWKSYVEVPLNESFERYDIDILDASGAVVKRTLAATEQTITYTAAEQTADFGGLVGKGALHVKIYQISETRGRGIEKGASV